MKDLLLGWAPFGTGRVKPFDQVFNKAVMIDPFKQKEEIKKCDAIIIWGGADISPSIYGEKVSSHTGATEIPSHRDEFEVACCNTAIDYGVPIIGICRGAQMVCALAGGKLIQHVTNHGRSHNIFTDDGRVMETSSVHHQMMYPWDVEHHLIAIARGVQSGRYVMGDDKDLDHWPLHAGAGVSGDLLEPEIVWFPKIKALAIQGHPEFMSDDCEFVQYCMELTKKYVVTAKESKDVCTC